MRLFSKLSTLYEPFLANLPLWVYILAYFVTVILGNILYQTHFGAELPFDMVGPSWFLMDTSIFGFEYHLLLWLPFLVLPLLAFATRFVCNKPIQFLAKFFPEFNQYFYAFVNIVLYVYVIYQLNHFHAYTLLMSGNDQIAATQARFLLAGQLGTYVSRCLLSLLPFMAVYAIVAAIRTRSWFWLAFAAWHLVALTCCLILLNMKWPIVLWIITVGLAVMVALRTLKSLVYCGFILLLAVGVFLGVSSLLQRRTPVITENAKMHYYLNKFPAESVLATDLHFGHLARQNFLTLLPIKIKDFWVLSPQVEDSASVIAMKTTMEKIAETDHHLHEKSINTQSMINLINRMAVPTLYYYTIFSQGFKDEHHLGIPSLIVYEKMFGDDGFTGRGTAPAASHITGFALHGWPGMLLCLTLTGILLGAFLVLWPMTQQSIMMTAIFVMGAQAAYFWTQLPLEGPILYSHGILWWALLLVGYALLSFKWLKK